MKLPDPSFSMSLIPVRKRWIYSFGDGRHMDGGVQLPYNLEKFLRYDLSYKKSWDKIVINNPSLVNGCQYGVLPLNVDGD